MKTLLRIVVCLVLLLGVAAAVAKPASDYIKKRNAPQWREAKVSSGDIVFEVNATGTVRPVLSVVVGSFVSGPIDKCNVDFNDEVKKDQVLATVDKRLYLSNVARDQAILMTRKAEVARSLANLQRAQADEHRALMLRDINKEYVSNTEMDQFKYNRQALEAALEVAEMAVDQSEANLENSQQNLDYCDIVSPVDGIVIDRKIDPGQTLAATFQTPELFVVAPDLRKEIYVYAQIDETDIGLIRKAFERHEPVRFQVDAYPEDIFVGNIFQIRLSSTDTQNVVTYPVIVSATNPELKLLPGMTATMSFQIQKREGIRRIPNAALRFFPEEEYVREEDQKLLGGREEKDDDEEVRLSVAERVEAHRKRSQRHVWVKEGDKLRAVSVKTGISDNRYTELVEGELKEDDQLVIGISEKKK